MGVRPRVYDATFVGAATNSNVGRWSTVCRWSAVAFGRKCGKARRGTDSLRLQSVEGGSVLGSVSVTVRVFSSRESWKIVFGGADFGVVSRPLFRINFFGILFPFSILYKFDRGYPRLIFRASEM